MNSPKFPVGVLLEFHSKFQELRSKFSKNSVRKSPSSARNSLQNFARVSPRSPLGIDQVFCSEFSNNLTRKSPRILREILFCSEFSKNSSHNSPKILVGFPKDVCLKFSKNFAWNSSLMPPGILQMFYQKNLQECSRQCSKNFT